MKKIYNFNNYEISSSVNNEELFNLTCEQDFFELELPKKLKNKIRSKTLNELSLKPKLMPKSILKVSLTALLAVLVLFIAITPSAMASIANVIRYIPGFNMLLSEESSPLERYVLEKPVEAVIGDNKVKIKGMMVDNNSATFYLSITGNAFSSDDKSTLTAISQSFIENMYAIDAKGYRYKIHASQTGIGHGLVGIFYIDGDIKSPQSIKLVFQNNEKLSINLSLTKVKDYNSYSELGPTDVKNGISVTAIVENKFDKKHITLLSPPQKSYMLFSYGIEKIKVDDANMNNYKIQFNEHETRIGPLNEFDIELKDIPQKSLSVTIPEIELMGYSLLDKEKFELPIPENKSMELNKKVEILGHPIYINRVVKLENNKLGVYVDLSKNEKNNEYIKIFSVNGVSMGQMNVVTGMLEYFEVSYNPDEKTKVFNVDNLTVVKKGPWILKIDK